MISQPAPNLSKLKPLADALEFAKTLYKFRLGINILISGSKEPSVNFAGVAPREVYWKLDENKGERKSWYIRRWNAFIEGKVREEIDHV